MKSFNFLLHVFKNILSIVLIYLCDFWFLFLSMADVGTEEKDDELSTDSTMAAASCFFIYSL